MLARFRAAVRRLAHSAVVRSQASRFVRLFVVALTASGVLDKVLSGGATRTSAIAAVVGAVEVAFRRWRPGAIDAVVKAAGKA